LSKHALRKNSRDSPQHQCDIFIGHATRIVSVILSDRNENSGEAGLD
jgi:hypothetical protein